jgi:hypothetical protein
MTGLCVQCQLLCIELSSYLRCYFLVRSTLISGPVSCEGYGTLLLNTDYVRQWYGCVFLSGTTTFFRHGLDLSVRPGLVDESNENKKNRIVFILILSTVWSGESSAELEKLGETW